MDTPLDQLLQHGVNALMLGGTYALLGIGLTLIFGIMRVVNFTHGELYAFGAYMMYALVMPLGLNFFLALITAILLGAALGALIELVLLSRLRGADIDTTMLVMIGAWIAMQNTEQLAWSGVAKSIDTPFPANPLVVGPVSVSWNRLFVFAIALGLIAATYGLINRTKLGKAMRATFQDRDTARLMGVDVEPHLPSNIRVGLGPRGSCRRPARPGLRGLSNDGRSGILEGLRDRHPRRPRQHSRRDHRRVHSRLHRGARRRLHLVGLPRRHGLPAHHPDPSGQADGSLCDQGADRVTRWIELAVVALLASIPLWLRDAYALHILITTGVFIIAAMSLNLLLGYTGQLSLGHVAFFGIGAYVTSLLSLGFEVHLAPRWLVAVAPKPVWFAMLTGTAVAGLAGWLIGRIAFKVRGAYFVIVTVSFAEVVRLVALNWVELTQGPMALNNIPPLTLWLPGAGEVRFATKTHNYYVMLAVAVVAFVVIRRLVQSRAGRAMIALRENEALATSVGVDVTRYLVLATVVAAAIAGAAGTLYAHYIRIVDPDIFLFIYTVTMVIMVITGGKGTLAGPIVGGIIFGFLPEILRTFGIPPEMQWIFYGVLMILVVYLLPQGIVPAVTNWWRGRTRGGGETPTGMATRENRS